MGVGNFVSVNVCVCVCVFMMHVLCVVDIALLVHVREGKNHNACFSFLVLACYFDITRAPGPAQQNTQ